MDIRGKFFRASAYEKGADVLVAFCGNAYPHDLSAENIDHIKAFYDMNGCEHEFLTEWPEHIEAAISALKANCKNGFMLLKH